jgi:hypothetical protein
MTICKQKNCRFKSTNFLKLQITELTIVEGDANLGTLSNYGGVKQII